MVDFRAASPFIDEEFNGEWRCSARVRQMRRAALSLANSSWQHGSWRHYRVRQRRYRLRVGDSVCGYGPLSETVIINAVITTSCAKCRKAAPGKTPSATPGAVCHERRARCQRARGRFLVVVGLGAIGQIAIQLAKRAERRW